jgi:hypothetical protein
MTTSIGSSSEGKADEPMAAKPASAAAIAAVQGVFTGL